MSRRPRMRPQRQRSSRDGYWRRMSWQEVEQALDYLFEEGLDNEQARRYAHCFRRARSQVSSLFLRMMCSRDPQERRVAAFVLEEIGGKQIIRPLQEFYQDPAISETVRGEVADLLQRLDALPPEPEGPSLVSHSVLSSQQAETRQVRSLEASPAKVPPSPRETPPPSPPEKGRPDPAVKALFQKKTSEVLALLEEEEQVVQLLAAFPHLSPKQQEAFLEKIAQAGEARALHFLLPLLRGEQWDGMEAVLTAVGRVGLPEALPAVREMAETCPRKRLKVRARHLLRELEDKAPPPILELPPLPEEVREEVVGPLYRAYATTVAGDGSQTLLVARERAEGSLKLLHIRHDDEEGLRECFFEETLTRPDFRALLSQLRSTGLVPVEVPLGYCNQMLTTAINLTERRGGTLPAGYLAAQQFCGVRRTSNPVVLKLEPASEIDHLKETPRLLARPEFQSWTFDLKKHPDLAARWWQARGRRNVSRQRKALITRLLQVEVDEAFLSRLRTRLQRQALLLQRLKETAASEWACVAAAALLKKFNLPPEEHPFLREMAAMSFQQASGGDSLPPSSESDPNEEIELESEGDRGGEERGRDITPGPLPEGEAELSPPDIREAEAVRESKTVGETEGEAGESEETEETPPEKAEISVPRSPFRRRRLIYSSRSRSRRPRW